MFGPTNTIDDFEWGLEILKASPMNVSSFIHHNDEPIMSWIKQNARTKFWVAGGACLAWYENKPTKNDIDIYFHSEQAFNSMKTLFGEPNKRFQISVPSNTDNAITYRIFDTELKRTHLIQLIRKNFYSKLEAVLDDFDITVCKIGWDGRRAVYRSSFVQDVKSRTLRFDNVSIHSHKRLVKYMAYGYNPAPGEIEKLTNSLNIDWEFMGNDHYA